MNQDFFYHEIDPLPYAVNHDEDSVSQIFNPFNQSNYRKREGYSYYSSDMKGQQWGFANPYYDFNQSDFLQNGSYQSYNLKKGFPIENYHYSDCDQNEYEIEAQENENSIEALIDSQLTNSQQVKIENDGVSQNVPQRSQKKTRGRLGKFSEHEDKKIMEIIRVKGLKFKYIAKLLPGKTPMMIKNRYYKRLRQIMNDENSENSESLQIKALNEQILNIEKQLNETKMEIFRELLNMMDFDAKGKQYNMD